MVADKKDFTEMGSKCHEGLPRTLLPEHYQLQVFDIDIGNNSFEGNVSIELTVVESTNQLVLNAKSLKVKHITATLNSGEEEVEELSNIDHSMDDNSEILTITFNEQLVPSSFSSGNNKLMVNIVYSGIIQTNMTGFYRSDFTKAGNVKDCCLSTQFEAASARTSFPCIDEPNFKATFGIELAVRNDWIALSNMPVLSKSQEQGITKYVFEKSVKMSTYLVAWACGDFEYIETFTEKKYNGKRIPVRCYTTEGLKERGEFGLNVAAKAVDFFSQIFEIDYPLPKLDLISIPTYSHGAMENYGLITFRETALLFDPNKSDSKYQQNVAYVVSHECAHQWFGNLVTINWWDELWLNEGFATWVGYLAVSHLYPEWDFFTKFVSGSLQSALGLDSLRGSHPVEVPVHSAAEINQVFDAISYLKGASIINMLSYALGVDVFLKGVSTYLKKHKFGNATTSDLWAGISESSGINVNQLMDVWIGKIGFPYLQVSTSSEVGKIQLQQRRFLANGDATEAEDQTIWWIPLNISCGPSSKDVIKLEGDGGSMTTKTVELSVNSFFKINKDSFGFYRVCYDSVLLQNIFNNIEKLSVRDKVGLIADVASTATASLSKTSSLLELIDSLKNEDSSVCWDQIISRLAAIRRTWFEQPEEIQLALTKFQRSVYGLAVMKLGFENMESDSYLTKALRADLLLAAGLAGVPEVVEHARKLFSRWSETGEIEPSFKSYAFGTILSCPSASIDDYNLVLREITSPSSIDAREIALNAVGRITNRELQQKVVELLKSDLIPEMDVQFLSASFGSNNSARWFFWNFIKENYDDLYTKLSANMVIWDRFLKSALSSFASEVAKTDIDTFFQDKPKDGFDRGLSQVMDQISTNSNWVEKDSVDVKEWLIRKRYL